MSKLTFDTTPQAPAKRPPTCAALQSQINDVLKAVTQLHDLYSQLDKDKVSVKDSWAVTAAVQTGMETAQKYYERAEAAQIDAKKHHDQARAIFSDTLAASKQAAKAALSLTNFERMLANYYRLSWYQRIFRAPKPPKEGTK